MLRLGSVGVSEIGGRRKPGRKDLRLDPTTYMRLALQTYARQLSLNGFRQRRMREPTVAIIAAVTTRGFQVDQPGELAFFKVRVGLMSR